MKPAHANEHNVTPIDHARSIAAAIPTDLPAAHRFVIALAGPPAAGKSTVAAALAEVLGDRAGLLGLDAFHFDDSILEERGHRPRKGSPHTFDVAAYAAMLRALRLDPQLEMSVPVYDRALSLARNCASMITAEQQILVTEGNYLLLDEAPWSNLGPLFDLTVWMDVPLAVVERRILDRWKAAALDASEIRRRTQENDLPNARVVQAHSIGADMVIRNYAADPMERTV